MLNYLKIFLLKINKYLDIYFIKNVLKNGLGQKTNVHYVYQLL